MRRHLTVAAFVGVLGIASQAGAQIGNVLFQENFNGLTLGDSVNDRRGPLSFAKRTVVATDATTAARPNAFTHTPPAGWVVDNNFTNFGRVDLANVNGADVIGVNSGKVLYRTGQVGFIVGNTGMPNQGSAADGVDEWEGWSFTNKDFWSSVDQQGREQFALASGNIAVMDADEYDDLGEGRGDQYMNSGLTTANIPVAGLPLVELKFDSSWQPEAYDDAHKNFGVAPDFLASNNQTALIWYSFDGGPAASINTATWNSDAGHTSSGPADDEPTRPASGTFKPTALSETVSHVVAVPAGAQNVKFTFALINSANDWWWTIDNLSVSNGLGDAAFWNENFDSLPLGPSVNERIDINPTFSRITAANNDAGSTPYPGAFTHNGPAGWSTVNSGIPAAVLGDNNVGVFEWEGWSYSNKDFWKFAGQGAAEVNQFTKGEGVIAIADSDEFADFGSPAAPFNTLLKTPVINITGLAAGELKLQFDSAWRDEGDQKAIITVDFGGGEIEVLRWESQSASPFFHNDNLNETVLLTLPNPAGATTAQVAFKYLDASNNWFWGIDNIVVGAGIVPEPATLGLAACMGLSMIAAGRRRRGG